MKGLWKASSGLEGSPVLAWKCRMGGPGTGLRLRALPCEQCVHSPGWEAGRMAFSSFSKAVQEARKVKEHFLGLRVEAHKKEDKELPHWNKWFGFKSLAQLPSVQNVVMMFCFNICSILIFNSLPAQAQRVGLKEGKTVRQT